LTFLPGQVGTTVNAIPSCSNGNPYDVAITGCDQGTNYSCGVPNNGNVVDLTINPDRDTGDAVSCLIHQANMGDLTFASGQDSLNPFGAPSSYPFQILAGTSNPLVGAGVAAGSPISSSTSIVAMPIYDVSPPAPSIQTNTMTNVTFVGFLQVFINAVDSNGNIKVTVLNVAGCSNGSGNPVGTPVVGTSPVPVRLITQP
jgi:hypothetical protein